jgi:hypothetical protein
MVRRVAMVVMGSPVEKYGEKIIMAKTKIC